MSLKWLRERDEARAALAEVTRERDRLRTLTCAHCDDMDTRALTAIAERDTAERERNEAREQLRLSALDLATKWQQANAAERDAERLAAALSELRGMASYYCSDSGPCIHKTQEYDEARDALAAHAERVKGGAP